MNTNLMTNYPIYSIGLMSGTSLDGVDIVYVKFDKKTNYSFDILHSETVAYPTHWLTKLKRAFYYNPKQLIQLNIDYGDYLSDLILDFIKKNQLKNIHFIASHGHTIHHKPEEAYTLQIGDGEIITSKTKIKTICDFRSQDVALGGQGAPLVPIGDALLFSNYTYCLNLGGFANISYKKKNQRVAFDICAVNTVLNYYANKLGLDFDDKGSIAKSGEMNLPLFKELNNLDYYKKNAPKSLGFEYVDSIVLPILKKYNLSIAIILNTYTEHIAFQIAQVIKNGSLFITGGGTFNCYLIDRIKHFTKNKIIIPSNKIIDYKEALIFSFLGLRRLENKINCLKSVTGAEKDHCSGEIFNPN